MKKVAAVLLMSTILLGVSTSALAAENTKSVGDSTAGIHLTTGEATPTTPVDPVDPTKPLTPDPENPATGNAGPLSLDYVSNITFGENEISTSNLYYGVDLNPFVQVTDTRGTGAGWSLKASISSFANENKDKNLAGAQLSLLNSNVKSSDGLATDKPVASNVIFNETDELQPVMTAAESTGKGTWLNVWSGTEGQTENKNVQLYVPASSIAADTKYSATITWELTHAPE